MNDEPVGTVIETEEIYGHTFKKRKSKIVQWLKKVDVGTLLYVNPSKEDEGKVCARCGAIAYDPVIKQTSKELTDEEIYQTWVEAKNTALNTRGSDFVEVIFARAILRKASGK
jgi:hypothetical protein